MERMGQIVLGLGRWWRAIVALVLGFSVLSVTGLLESQLFYWPIRGEAVAPENAEDVWFVNPDGQRLHGWWLPARGVEHPAAAPTIVHVHGNMGHIAFYYLQCSFLQEAGFNVLLFDYRGFGRSDEKGAPLERADLLADTQAAIAFARTKTARPDQPLGVYGLSLGGVIGLAASERDPGVDAVVSVAAFSSWEQIARDRLGWIGTLLIEPGLDAEESAAGLGDRPLLVIHGEFDRTADPSHAGRIIAAARERGVKVTSRISPGAFHINPVLSDPESQRLIVEFFSEHLRTDEPEADR